MNRNFLTVVIGAVLIVIFTMLLLDFKVRQSEVAVVTTFGKPVRDLTDPGAYFKWPWPVQKVYKFDQRVQNFEDKFSESLTADNNMLLTSVYVGWKIYDAKSFFPKFAGGSVPAAQRMLESMLRSAKSAIIGRHTLSEFVNANPKDLQFDAIENEIEQAVQAQLQTNACGIQLEFLGFKKIGLPESVTQAVFERMTSERTVLINRAKYEGEAEAQKIKSAADRQASEVVNNAVADATRIRGEGEAEAAKVLPVFQQNPELANFLLRIDALQQTLNQRSTLIFDERTPPFDLFTGIPDQSARKINYRHERRARTSSRARARTRRAGAWGRCRFAGAGRGAGQQLCDCQSRHGADGRRVFLLRLFHRRPAGKGGDSPFRQAGRRRAKGFADVGIALVAAVSD